MTIIDNNGFAIVFFFRQYNKIERANNRNLLHFTSLSDITFMLLALKFQKLEEVMFSFPTIYFYGDFIIKVLQVKQLKY